MCYTILNIYIICHPIHLKDGSFQPEVSMSDYSSMLRLAQSHHFTSFTELQDCAFKNADTYHYEKDLFIMGATSSGKTLIPMLLYCAALQRAEERGEAYPKMLFVVPYRALAAQKTAEMKQFFEGKNLKIIQSTGEFRQDDAAVRQADVHIAVVITEKVYKYEAKDPSFLSKYDYLVPDEIGLINNADRGVRLDFIFAWAANQKQQTGRPRVIALGTPFFDWSAYIESYGYTEIKTEKRPVSLREISTVYSDSGIEHVDGTAPFLHRARIFTQKELQAMENKYGVAKSQCEECPDGFCPVRLPCRTDLRLLCSETNRPCHEPIEIISAHKKNVFRTLLLKICREHLSKGHQILIFINDRVKVRQLCGFLYKELQEFLPEAPSAEECKKKLLADCALEGDDVFGILEQDADDVTEAEYYRAFSSGIAFHSAALPNELRTYVEEKLLSNREMRIVCSTETLAFGVNSSVDTVIIADLYKQESSSGRYLSLNEHRNYAGRAGRLRSGTNASQINGYVYTLIRKKQEAYWNEMREGNNTPEKLYSLFHTDDGQFMPFFLLNLLPVTSDHAMTVADLVRAVRILPRDDSAPEIRLPEKIEEALQFLKEQGIAEKVASSPLGMRRAALPNADRYCLTALGSRLRGYIIGRDDYIALQKAIKNYVKGIYIEPDKASFLYSLLCTKHAENGLNNIFFKSTSRADIDSVREYIRSHSNGLSDETAFLRSDKTAFILAALLAWSEGESPKTLYKRFGIPYALLNKLAEQIAYLIEIAKEILPSQMENVYREKRSLYENTLRIDFNDFTKAVEQKLQQMQDLFVSIYYGINTRIVKELYDFVCAQTSDPPPESLLRELSPDQLDPTVARKLRRIVIRYHFFGAPPKSDSEDIEIRNNYLDQLRQYKADVKGFGRHIFAFFKANFKDTFTD